MDNTPLYHAIKNGRYDAAVLLLNNGATPTTKLLHRIAYNNWISPYIDLLLKYGADWGDILLEIDYNKNIWLAWVAIKKGARTDISDSSTGSTPLHVFINQYNNWSDVSSYIEDDDSIYGLLDVMIKHTSDINAKDNKGIAPIHLAVKGFHDTRLLDILIDNGADINIRDHNQRTPLHHAAYNGAYPEVSSLLDSGANLKATDICGYTPLHTAIKSGETKISLALLDVMLGN
jgi:ankyrin repeat protein